MPRRAGIATIYQELLLFPELSVAENIFMGHAPRTRLGALDWRAMRAPGASELLASLDIHDLDVDAARRRALGRQPPAGRDRQGALAERPHPDHGRADGGADRGRRRSACSRIVRLLRERGVGIVYISHRLEEVFELADRVTVLRDGAYVGTREVAETSTGRADQR